MNLWEIPEEYPPIYNVASYAIKDKRFFSVAGFRRARYLVLIDFRTGNILPSGNEWIFELKDVELGWKVANFYILDEKALKRIKSF